MEWNANERIPDGPLTKLERKSVRVVLRWFDQREYIRSGLKSWAIWLVALPTAMVGLWQIFQLVMGHLK